MVATPLEFSPRIKLVVKYVSHIMESLELILWEQVKPIVAGSLEAGREGDEGYHERIPPFCPGTDEDVGECQRFQNSGRMLASQTFSGS